MTQYAMLALCNHCQQTFSTHRVTGPPTARIFRCADGSQRRFIPSGYIFKDDGLGFQCTWSTDDRRCTSEARHDEFSINEAWARTCDRHHAILHVLNLDSTFCLLSPFTVIGACVTADGVREVVIESTTHKSVIRKTA